MNILYYLIICSLFFSCLIKSNVKSNSKIEQDKRIEKDSLKQFNYQLFKEFAICKCLYAVPENKEMKNRDVSPSIYANILNYIGIDTLNYLATIEGQKLQPEVYVDYENKKGAFFRCSRWANSPKIDSLLQQLAEYTVQDRKWEIMD
jgi:hypothetical protein